MTAFWSQFSPTEKTGILITLSFFTVFVFGCTLIGDKAGIFIDAVGAFGQVSIAAGLYLLTRGQLREARQANEQASNFAQAETARINKEREDSSKQAKADDLYKLRRRATDLEALCERVIKGHPISRDDHLEINRLVVAFEADDRFGALENQLRIVREVGQRMGTDRERGADKGIFRNSKIGAIRGLEDIIRSLGMT